MPPSGCGIPSRSRSAEKRVRSSAWSIASRSLPSSGIPACREVRGEVERRLAAERDDRGQGHVAALRLGLDDAPNALRVERLEVEAGAGVEVGRDRLRVRVDHHGLPAAAAERLGGADRAVVELDPLPDPDGTRADDERGRAVDRWRLRCGAGGGVRRVEVRRLGGELCGAGVDHRVARPQAELFPRDAERRLRDPGEAASSRSPNPARFAVASSVAASPAGSSPALARVSPAARTSASRATLRAISARNHGAMPVASWIVASGTPRRSRPRRRQRRESDGSRKRRRTIGAAVRCAWRVDSQAAPVSSTQRIGSSSASSSSAGAAVDRGEVVERRRPARVLGERPGTGLLEAAQRLVQRGPEGPVDRHHLAGRLHLAAERAVGGRELVEREAGQLDDDVVERRLEGGDGRAGDDVRDLGQPPPDRDLGGDARDRVAGGLAGEGRRSRHARVDLDDRVVGRVRRQRELDVAAALDAERADDRERRAAEALVDRVRQRLDGRDHDRVAGVDAERVDVLHRAHGDAGVVGVAHHLVLDLLPADEALLDHDLADRARAEARPDPLAVGVLGADDAAAGATERERRPDDRRQTDLLERQVGRCPAVRVGRTFDDPAGRVRLADPLQQVPEAARGPRPSRSPRAASRASSRCSVLIRHHATTRRRGSRPSGRRARQAARPAARARSRPRPRRRSAARDRSRPRRRGRS